MTVTVLLASGDEDTWEGASDVQMSMDMGGALLILGEEESLNAIYAPGMWMKVEIERSDDSA